MRNLFEKLKTLIPFSYANILLRSINKKGIGDILDVGCGSSPPFSILKSSIAPLRSVGVDVSLNDLKKLRIMRIYNSVILADARFLPFKYKSFDVILCSFLIEHLHKGEGINLIKDFLRICRRRIIIVTNNGPFFRTALKRAIDLGNPLLIHKSAWRASAFRYLNFEIKGHGSLAVYGDAGIIETINSRILRIIIQVISYFFEPLFYFFPDKFSFCLICIKDL